jgi:uncharacterized membrane protein YkvA (DUF1232 family)
MDVVVGIVASLLAAWAVFLVIFWLLRPKGVAVGELVRLVPDVVRLLRGIVGDRTAPLDVRLVVVGLMVWLVSPIDLIPEFVPVIGPIDDVVVAVVALRYVRRRIGEPGLRGRWAGSDAGFALLGRVVGMGPG